MIPTCTCLLPSDPPRTDRLATLSAVGLMPPTEARCEVREPCGHPIEYQEVRDAVQDCYGPGSPHRPLAHTHKVTTGPFYLTAGAVIPGAANAGGVQDPSIPTPASKEPFSFPPRTTKTPAPPPG